MPSKYPLPQPLFDTLDYLPEEMHDCIQNYIKSTRIQEAQKEFELTREFLLSYGGSQDTYNAYRREVERVLHWAWIVQQKPLKEINRNDIREYLEFSNHPPLHWMGTKTVARFHFGPNGIRKANPEWRLYVAHISKAQRHAGGLPDKHHYVLSNKSVQAMFSSLSTYFKFLQQEGYLEINPISLVRQKKRYIQRQQTQKVTRKLSRLQWLYAIETAEQMAKDDPENERVLFLMTTFYLLGLRISEVSETPGRIPCMGDFAPDKNGLWWFTTISKGNKIRDVAIPDAMFEALKRYRLSRGLPAIPARNEQTPLLAKQRGQGGLGTRQVRNLVQSCFDQAILRLKKAGKIDEAEDLETATVHWLRHTSISSDIEERPREHIRDDVGHESAATMDKYIDIDRAARHQSAKNKSLKPKPLTDIS